MLVPALALVAVALTGTAIDLVAVQAVQRRTQSVIASAADDAAGMVDARRIQLDAVTIVDPVAARRAVENHLRASPLPGRLQRLDVTVRADRVALAACMSRPPGGFDDDLAAVTVPVLVVAGADDDLAGDPAGLADRVADGRSLTVPGGHFDANGHPALQGAVIDFVLAG